MRCCIRTVLGLGAVVCIAVLFGSVEARAALRDFTPRVYKAEAEIDGGGYYEKTTDTMGGSGLEIKDTYLAGSFVYTASGWIYHPRFAIFLAKIGAGISYEKVFYRTAFFTITDDSKTDFLREYEFRIVFLPEHPYNLELYTLRRNPYIRGRVMLGLAAVATDTGAIFRYKRRPYALNMSYSFSTIDSSRYTTDVTKLKANGVYFKDWGNLTGAFSHTTAENSQTVSTAKLTSDDYQVQNQLRFWNRRLYIESSVDQIFFKQRSSFQDLDDSRFGWNEKANMLLPGNFDTTLYYDRFHETSKVLESESGLKRTVESTSNIAGVSITHRLYQSLITSYNFNHQSVSTTTGDTKGPSHSLSSIYTKRIPGGQMIAGGSWSRSSIDRTGSPSVVNEPHSAMFFGEFTLNQSDIDSGTVDILVKKPDTGELVALTRDVDYLLAPSGNTLSVRIVSLPADVLTADPAFTYEFLASYSITPEDSTILTTTRGASLKLLFFNNSINPYISYNHGEQTVKSGTFPGTPTHYTINTYGIELARAPFTALVEYQVVKSNQSPTKTLRAEVECRTDLWRNAYFHGKVFYRRTDYQEGLEVSMPFVDKLVGGNAMLHQRIPRKNLDISLGGYYTKLTGREDTSTYAVNGDMTWTRGKLEVRLGGALGRSRLQGGAHETSHEALYLTFKRKLF